MIFPILTCITFMRLLTLQAIPLTANFTLKRPLFESLCLEKDLFASSSKTAMVFLIFLNKPRNLKITNFIEIFLSKKPSDILNVHVFLAIFK